MPGDRQLVLYAADLVRAPDGRLCALTDYAQAPSGAGFALENRLVLSRVLPGLYRDVGVRRLAPFFRALRATLASLAPPGVSDPNIVLMTPGPLNEAYYEHAHLARHLGYPLVDSRDLFVRSGRVWLQSVSGPVPVDVILRRVDSWYTDPLALKPTSRLGVPGLVEVARRGRVSVVNGFGASVVENPGLLPFLPAAARFLLDEELLLPSPLTWWCGDDSARAFVLDHLEDLVVKPLTPPIDRSVVFPDQLDAAERDALRRRIEARPADFVGQQRVSFSTAPSLEQGRLEPRHIALRAFAVAADDSYLVLPGGLARVSPGPHDQHLSAQLGGSSKDTWVIAAEPERVGGFWLTRGPRVAALDASDVISPRAAENLFWMGRYAERAETVVRVVRAALDRHGEFSTGADPDGVACLHVLLRAVTRLTDGYPGFVGPGAEERLAAPGPGLRGALMATDHPSSLACSLRRLVGAANAVRDQLSNDTWLAVGAAEDALRELAPRPDVDDGGGPAATAWAPVLATVLRDLLALAGVATESMVRDPGWHFLDAGRRIERGVLLARLLDTTVVVPATAATDSLVLESLLVITESIITYRRRYRSRAQLQTVLDLLLTDATNPRSLGHALVHLGEDLKAMAPRQPATPPGDRSSEPSGARTTATTRGQRLSAELTRELSEIDTATLAEALDGQGQRAELSAQLRTTAQRLETIADAVDDEHFDRRQPERTLLVGQSAALGDVIGASMP